MSIQQHAKFNAEQYATILNFLEDPQNYAKIFGVRGKTEVGVAPPRKIQAWKELATLINTKFKGKYKVDHKSVADRWHTYFSKYKAARDKSSGTGFGITDEDKKRGIHTLAAKLDSMCPHYERMHALVGGRPNVQAGASFESGCITPETDLNELLRFTAEDLPAFRDVEPPSAEVDTNVDELGIVTLVSTELLCIPTNEQLIPPATNEGHDDAVLTNSAEASPAVASGSKRPAVFISSDGNESKNDRRKQIPSLAGTKNATNARNQFAQSIQDCASVKATALITIEEKKLKFEQSKWETEREDRLRKEEKEDRLRLDEIDLVKRADEKAEKCRERRFTLLQTLIKEGKSPEEINYLLSMLL